MKRLMIMLRAGHQSEKMKSTPIKASMITRDKLPTRITGLIPHFKKS